MFNNFIRLIRRRTENIYLKESFSTNGEDILINSILRNVSSGFYLDVGAHHPFRFSNTHLLFKRGWRGMNVDASFSSIELFNKYRKRDINVLMAINEKKELLTYYSNKLGALNTFDKNLYKQNPEKYTKLKEIQSNTLESVINDHLTFNQRIDFVNIDIEGFDLKALRTFPWDNYQPKLICVEDLDFNPGKPRQSEIYNYVVNQGYVQIAFIPSTLFFIPV